MVFAMDYFGLFPVRDKNICGFHELLLSFLYGIFRINKNDQTVTSTLLHVVINNNKVLKSKYSYDTKGNLHYLKNKCSTL